MVATSNTQSQISDLGPTAENQQITTFIDDVDVESYEKPMMSSATAWTTMAEDSKLHDINAILQRPVQVLAGEFNTVFESATLKFPDVIFQKSLNVVKKLDYFTFLRANVKVKLIFNATPFMSGRYWLFFSPFDAVSNRGSELLNLQNNTGYPGIEVDLATGAPVEIKIPYCAPLSHYNLLDTHSNMGELFIIPLNAIQTGTSPVVQGATFQVFAWFEDVELALPTSLPITVPTLQAQVGGSEEQAATSGPPISGTANIVAGAASALGTAIPTLGKWLRPVEWVSRAISGAASAVGWNKPTNLDKNCPFINVPAKGYTNVDGIDMSSKLAAMPDNGLTMEAALFSTDVDEMDINYVCSKSCIYKSAVPWTTSDLIGKQLFANNVAPGLSNGSSPSISPTTLGFATSIFRYWRGGLKFRITAAKTAFHTGRIRITYHPGIYDTGAANRVHENAYNWIMDLSVSSELEILVPYVSNVPWKEVYVTDVSEVNVWRLEKYSTGHLTFEVLTQLRAATDTVANNVPLNFWISAADDFSLAIPDFGSYAIGTTPIVLEAQVFNQATSAIEHNEQTTASASQMFPKSLMGPTTAEELTMGEKITSLRQLIKRFGITSRGLPYPYKDPLTATYNFPGPIPLNNDSYLFNQLEIDPGYFGKANGNSVTSSQNVTLPYTLFNDGSFSSSDFTAAVHYPTRSPLYYISYLYRFYRGGRRYKVVNPTTNGLKSCSSGWRSPVVAGDARTPYTNVLDSMEYITERPSDPLLVSRNSLPVENGVLAGPQVSTFLFTETASVFEHYVYPDLNGTVEFEVPYYGQTPISLVGEGSISDTEGPLIKRSKIFVRRSEDPRGMDKPMYDYFTNRSGAESVPDSFEGGIRNCFGAYTLYEAAADDFTFGYLVGAPRIQRVA